MKLFMGGSVDPFYVDVRWVTYFVRAEYSPRNHKYVRLIGDRMHIDQRRQTSYADKRRMLEIRGVE